MHSSLQCFEATIIIMMQKLSAETEENHENMRGCVGSDEYW
jgi:hypothetical protein